MKTCMLLCSICVGLCLFSCKSGEGSRYVPASMAAGQSANTYCGLFFECACETIPYGDKNDCVEERRNLFEQVHYALLQLGAKYDGRCLGMELDLVDDQACDPPGLDEDVEIDCADLCFIYHGEQGKGQPCSYYLGGGGYSNCSQGLICDGVKCVDPCKLGDDGQMPSGTLGPGEQCRDPSDGLLLGDCAEGLYCDAGYTDTCQILPEEGEECPMNICAEGLWCGYVDSVRTCVSTVGLGRDCTEGGDGQCKSGYCQNGVCSKIPGVGQACTDRCKEGLMCLDTGFCSEGPGLDEACFNNQCAPGLICDGGFCRQAPPAICNDVYN